MFCSISSSAHMACQAQMKPHQSLVSFFFPSWSFIIASVVQVWHNPFILCVASLFLGVNIRHIWISECSYIWLGGCSHQDYPCFFGRRMGCLSALSLLFSHPDISMSPQCCKYHLMSWVLFSLFSFASSSLCRLLLSHSCIICCNLHLGSSWFWYWSAQDPLHQHQVPPGWVFLLGDHVNMSISGP